MCVAENTLRGVSVELSAISGQQRRRTQRSFLEKVVKSLFRQSQGAWHSAMPFSVIPVSAARYSRRGVFLFAERLIPSGSFIILFIILIESEVSGEKQ